MSKKGTVTLEAVIASGLTLLLLSVLASLLIVYWQTWHETTRSARERQWTAVAFEYLDRDIAKAERVMLTATEIRITLSEGDYVYKVGLNKSFRRGQGRSYLAFSVVESARWWWEGELLWVELTYADASYRCCYYIPEDRR